MSKEIVEINGVKFEVDLSKAQVISEYQIGQKVSVLVKEYQDKVVYPGIIVDFENFKELPTITIAYLKIDYNEAKVKFVHFNEQNKDIDIAPCRDTELTLTKGDIIKEMDREIARKEEELHDLEMKKDFFLKNFQKHFEEFEAKV